MADPRPDRSLGELFGDLAEQLGKLIRQEAELARTEMTANATKLAKDASLAGAGAVLAHAGLLALVAAAIALLNTMGLPLWIAALVIALVLFGVGFALVTRGREQIKSASLAPTRTIESVKEDVDWARSQTK